MKLIKLGSVLLDIDSIAMIDLDSTMFNDKGANIKGIRIITDIPESFVPGMGSPLMKTKTIDLSEPDEIEAFKYWLDGYEIAVVF